MVSHGTAVVETLVQGQGPTLVMLPSYGRGGGRDFDAFAALIANAGFRVLRPQPRGVGRSSGPMNASLREMADDVAEVIRRLANGTAVVLGHAFGNGVTRLLAATRGERVKGIILAAAATSSVPKKIDDTPFIAGDPTLPEQERLAALRLAFFAPHHDARCWLEGWYPETLRMQQKAVEASHPKEFRTAGTAPILQVIAESDPFSPYPSWRALREECGDRVTTRIVADAGHALFPEQTELVAEIVSDWMKKLWT
jgi:pimeloyl-ACP methyl ester carboxylesterase